MSLQLTPRGLQYIEAVAEHGSIQAASRSVGIAASAIDRQIKLMEERLGVLLFDRMTTGMSITPAGEMFVVLARRWRADENQIFSDIKKMQGVDLGHIRTLAMDSLVNGLVPRFLARMAASYPRVRIDVDVGTPDDVVIALEDGKCDIALAFNLLPQRDLHVVWSTDLPLYCVLRPDHALASSKNVTLNDVRNHANVVQSRALPIRRILEARHSWMFSNGPPPVVTNSLQLLKHLVVEGNHVALTSEMDAAPELLDGRLVGISVSGINIPGQSISVVINSRRVLPRMTMMVSDILADEAQVLLAAVRAKT